MTILIFGLYLTFYATFKVNVKYSSLFMINIVKLIDRDVFRFVAFFLKVIVNNFLVMSGCSHRFLGITSIFCEVNVSCSRTQYGDLSEDRTPDHSLQRP